MVVCDGAMVLNLVASVMMNGVCCIHSMQEEEKRQEENRQVIRNAINVEWQRQRLMELEQQEALLKEQGLDAATLLAKEKRRLLMLAKMEASSSSSQQERSMREQPPQPPQEDRDWTSLPNNRTRQQRECFSDHDDFFTRTRSAPIRFPTPPPSSVAQSRGGNGVTSRSGNMIASSVPVVAVVTPQTTPTNHRPYCTTVSSLMDDDDDDDDDDDEEEEEEEKSQWSFDLSCLLSQPPNEQDPPRPTQEHQAPTVDKETAVHFDVDHEMEEDDNVSLLLPALPAATTDPVNEKFVPESMMLMDMMEVDDLPPIQPLSEQLFPQHFDRLAVMGDSGLLSMTAPPLLQEDEAAPFLQQEHAIMTR